MARGNCLPFYPLCATKLDSPSLSIFPDFLFSFYFNFSFLLLVSNLFSSFLSYPTSKPFRRSITSFLPACITVSSYLIILLQLVRSNSHLGPPPPLHNFMFSRWILIIHLIYLLVIPSSVTRTLCFSAQFSPDSV